MNLVLLTGLILAFCTALSFALILRKVVCHERSAEFTPEWLSEYSVDRYKPMLRLLSEDDYNFLAAQKGFDPRIAKRLRTERRKIFRGYLRWLRRDFNRLESAVRLFMVHSAQDRPDLAKALLRRRLTFTCAVFAVECRLVLHTLGLGTVDARGLVGSLGTMHAQIGEFALARQASLS